MNVAEATQRLVQIYESGQLFRFVVHAQQVLRVTSHAPRLALLALRALVQLGLGGPARELLQLRADLTDAGDELQDLKNRSAALPNGRVDWTERRDTFARNVQALLTRRPQFTAHLPSLKAALANLQLYRTSQNNYQLSQRREPRQLRQWLPPLTDEGEEDRLVLPPRGQLGVAAVVGVRAGSLLSRLYRETQHLFLSYSHPIYLFEPDAGRLAAWLHVADHRELLSDERVYLWVGPVCVDDFERHLAREPGLAIPTVYLNLGADPALARQVARVAERVAACRQAELARLVGELRNRHAPRDSAYWAKRLRAPRRVLGMTSRYTTVLQYSTRDALRALQGLGYEPHTAIEAKDHYFLSAIETCRKILEVDPDFILCLDHLRYEYPHIPPQVPFLTWIQDPLPNLLCRRAGQSVGPLDFVCGHWDDSYGQQFGYPKERYFPTDVPVSSAVFHNDAWEPTTAAAYACDVCFVSHASTPAEQYYQSALAGCPASQHALLKELVERVPELERQEVHEQPDQAALALVRAVAAEHSLALADADVQRLAYSFVYRLFDWGRRQETLGWVADWVRRSGRVFKLYGRGWENHPSLAAFAAGVVEHGEPLRCAYRAAKLALQLIPSGFKHQRSYEILASGTLPLTRYCRADFARPNVVGFPGLHRITFRTRAEFEALAEHYLSAETDRQAVLHELREVVLRHHTYDAVMGRLLDAWRRALDSPGARSSGARPNTPSAATGAPAGVASH